jgi:hypothetical protein
MPVVKGPDGVEHDLATREGRAAVAAGYLAREPKWLDSGLWPDGASPVEELRRLLGTFSTAQYARIVELGSGARGE